MYLIISALAFSGRFVDRIARVVYTVLHQMYRNEISVFYLIKLCTLQFDLAIYNHAHFVSHQILYDNRLTGSDLRSFTFGF